MGNYSFPILMVALLALMFLMSSRQRKAQKTAQEFRKDLQPGQEVMTGSGLFGYVVSVDEATDSIVLETTPGGPQTRWLRAAIAKRVDTVGLEVPAAGGADAPAVAPLEGLDVPHDISGLDTAAQEYRAAQDNQDPEAK